MARTKTEEPTLLADEIAAPAPMALVARPDEGAPIETPPRNLAMKLAECMSEIQGVEKRGRNEFHKYDYATEADISRVVRGALSKRHIIAIPRITGLDTSQRPTAKGGTDYVAIVHLTVALIDGESGETIEIPWVGIGQDAGEKGIYKGITGGLKYLFSKLFLIPSGDDPEKDSPEERDRDRRRQEKPAAPAPPPPAEYAVVGKPEIELIRGIAKPRGFSYSAVDDAADVKNLRNVLQEVGGVRDLRAFPLDKLDALTVRLNEFDPKEAQ